MKYVSAPTLTYESTVIATSGCSKGEIESLLVESGKLSEINAGGGCMGDPPDSDPLLYGAILYENGLWVWCSAGRVDAFAFSEH